MFRHPNTQTYHSLTNTCTHRHTYTHSDTYKSKYTHTDTHRNTYIHTHAHLHTCIHMYTHVHTQTHRHSLSQTQIHTNTYILPDTHTQTHTHSHTHSHTYTHTHTQHTLSHTHTYTHIGRREISVKKHKKERIEATMTGHFFPSSFSSNPDFFAFPFVHSFVQPKKELLKALFTRDIFAHNIEIKDFLIKRYFWAMDVYMPR